MLNKLSISSTIRLASGYEMPRLGLGVYQVQRDLAQSVVTKGLDVGYTHIDSATGYRNEAECAAAIAAHSTPREEIFFTTKLPPMIRGYEQTKSSLNGVIEGIPELGGYVDLYLIHAPYGTRETRIGQWKAMVEAQKEGKVRSLGVSNYGVHHLDELKEWMDSQEKENAGVLSVGQWEIHPWLGRAEIRNWCQKNNVVVQAYSPLVRARRLDDPLLQPLVKKYNKTAAQILVRWSLQMNLVPLPKSITPERIEENANVYDFELTDEEVKALDTGRYEPCAWDPTTSGLDT